MWVLSAALDHQGGVPRVRQCVIGSTSTQILKKLVSSPEKHRRLRILKALMENDYVALTLVAHEETAAT